MSNTDGFTLDDIAPVKVPKSAAQSQKAPPAVNLGDILPERELPQVTVRPSDKEPKELPGIAAAKKVASGVQHAVDVTGTAIEEGVMDTLGLPGTIAKAAKEENKGKDTRIPGDVGALTGASEAFHKLIQQHLPTGEEIKKWYYDLFRDKVTGKSIDVHPEGLPGKMYAEGVKTLSPFGLSEKVTAGGKVLMGTSGAVGELMSNLSEEHPDLARFFGAIGTAIGVPLALKGGGAAKNMVKAARDVELNTGKSLAKSAGEDAATLEAKIAAGQHEIVPGSKPTTAQAADSANLSASEREMRESPNVNKLFQERQAQQNEARLAAAAGIEPAGAKEAPRDFLEGVRKQHKTTVDKIEQDAAQKVTKELDALGPGATPDQAGRVIVDAAREGYDKAKLEVNKAYNTILEPGRGKEIGIDTGPAIRRVDKVIRDRIPETYPADSRITALRDVIENEKAPMSFKDMNGLVTRAGDLAGSLVKQGKTRDAGVAMKIKEILLDRMDASASETAKVLPYTKQAEVEARTIAERVKRLNELRDINNQDPLKRWSSSREALEKQIKEAEGRVKDKFGITGDLTPQEWERYQGARTLRQEVGQRYEQGALADVVGSGAEVGGTKLTPSEAPARLFHAGPSRREDIKQAVDVLGGNENAMAAMREYAVGNLKATVERAGGELTPKVLQKWLLDHRDALQPFPDLRNSLSTVQKVQEAMRTLAAPTVQNLENFEKSAARHFLSREGGNLVDPDAAVKSALGSKTATADMAQLAQMAKMDKSGEALRGLQASVRDNFLRSAGTKSLDQDGVSLLSDKGAREWLKNNKDKVAPVMTKEHIETLEKIAADLSRGTKGAGAGMGPMTLSDALQSALGGYHKMVSGIPGLGGGVGKLINKVMFGHSEAEVRDLYTKALMDPDLARTLLRKVDQQSVSRLGRYFGPASSAAGGAATGVGVRTMAREPQAAVEE